MCIQIRWEWTEKGNKEEGALIGTPACMVRPLFILTIFTPKIIGQ
jgi:hypothetical protein